MELITSPALPSLARASEGPGRTLTVGVVQMHWQPDADAHAAALANGVRRAAEAGAQVVFLPELTLSRYPADFRPEGRPADLAESLEDGPTRTLVAKLAADNGVFVHASLYEAAPAPDGSDDGLGYNTAILVAPGGELVGRTRKTHIPVTEGYFEDLFFRHGPADEPYPVHVPDLAGAPRLGLPTCWDEWFPEVARAYSLADAEVLAYPTAIGSEPDHPDFDTQPLWQHVIVGNGITSGLFMCVPNRWGNEGRVDFYGSSFISDPYGRILAQAPRSGDAVLVATLDLDQRRDWLTLFPFLDTRRPDTYASLTAPR
ncbi:nitrilase-related carbon-nitrogen hydrolase [Nocardioides jejuensis]|uniref:Hydrolase n=1 Tax=Nocardioides jejuensis TaxID=2502782 RepID=A0A4R1CGS1_9ACTN|nr:nitrilase-related carbon-nitrogen hydrolase [Nocardioides jejuensis]TCJ30563.1 hydrolase [Nocardioides jejuensis]